MNSPAKNKSSCAYLLFLLLIVHSAVIQVGALWIHPERPLDNRSSGYGVAVLNGAKIPGRVMANFIPAETPPPISVTRVLTTCYDGQTSVSVKVFEGDSYLKERERERYCAQYYGDGCDALMKNQSNKATKEYSECEYAESFCHYIMYSYTYFGKVELHGIPPAPRGLPQIEVTFTMKDWRVNVTVTDKSTMKSNSTSFSYGIIRIFNELYDYPYRKGSITMHRESKAGVCLYDATRLSSSGDQEEDVLVESEVLRCINNSRRLYSVCMTPRLSSSGAQGEHLLLDRDFTGEKALPEKLWGLLKYLLWSYGS